MKWLLEIKLLLIFFRQSFKLFSMSNFLKSSFWFDRPVLPFNANILWLIFIICLLAIAAGIVSTYLRRKKLKNNKLALKTWKKLGQWLYSFGVVGLILIFFKQQMTPYLGMRFWFVLWLLAWLIWLIFIVKYIVIEIPIIKREQIKKQELEKYLP